MNMPQNKQSWSFSGYGPDYYMAGEIDGEAQGPGMSDMFGCNIEQFLTVCMEMGMSEEQYSQCWDAVYDADYDNRSEDGVTKTVFIDVTNTAGTWNVDVEVSVD